MVTPLAPANSNVSRRTQLPQFRVTVNSRCGRACFFCRPSGEAVATPPGSEIPVDKLIVIAKIVRDLGIDSIKLTGGDPALYEHLEEAVRRLSCEAHFKDIEVISRHPLIGVRASHLAKLGVTRFNLSVDTLDRTLHHELCGVDDLAEILHAVEMCAATGIPVKVNTVVMSGINDAEIAELISFCERIGADTLKLLDVIKDLDSGSESFARRLAIRRGRKLRDLYRPLSTLTDELAVKSVRRELQTQGDLGHPMTVLHMQSGLKILTKDSRAGAWYGSICQQCSFFPCHDALMALRLTSDVQLQFCLLRDDLTLNLSDIDDEKGLRHAISKSLETYQSATFRSAMTNTSILQLTPAQQM